MQTWKHKTPASCPVVVITWRDIQEFSAWDEDDDIKPAVMQTIGWLLHDGPLLDEPEVEVVITAKTYQYQEKRWADYTCFPKTVIKTMDGAK